MTPRPLVWSFNGLEHRALEWAAPRNEPETPGATVILVHGFQDCGATWDDVAVELAHAGLRVIAPDMRGFGDAPRVPPGGYYYFPDYVADLASLVAREARDVPLFLVGHSMGATIVSQFAGAFPERLTKLALIDGVGPPDHCADLAPLRMRRWVETAYEAPTADRKPMTRADALARLKRFNSYVDDAVLARKITQLTRALDGAGVESDALAWKYDLLHTTTSPTSFYAEAYKAFARRVTCPVLFVSGGVKGFHVPDQDERLGSFPALTKVTLEGGHALHWTMPKELAEALVTFWRG